MKIKVISVLILFLSFNQYIFAGEYCWNDKVLMVIVQGEKIFFTSEKSCNNWCEISDTWSAEAKNRAFTQLITAKATESNITFFWSEHDSGKPCQSFLPTYSKPGVIALN